MKKEELEDDDSSISLPSSSEDEQSKPAVTGKRTQPENSKVQAYLYYIA